MIAYNWGFNVGDVRVGKHADVGTLIPPVDLNDFAETTLVLSL